MWQGWIAFLDGFWLVISSFIWQTQTNQNLLISGIVLTIFGFWAEKSWEGIMLGFLGVFVIGSGCTHYLVLPINFFLTGLTIMAVAFLCATINKRSHLHLQL
ncbi:MAG: hypothetical protein M1480_14300 [Bacteroidetes bacterium]|nr:hypothetical protein [Bacteroidota bacterium]